jgi:hypothetical protein
MNPEPAPSGLLLVYLALLAFVHCRDEEAVMETFRDMAISLDDTESMRIYRLAEKTMTGADRLWLATIAGRPPDTGTMKESSPVSDGPGNPGTERAVAAGAGRPDTVDAG